MAEQVEIEEQEDEDASEKLSKEQEAELPGSVQLYLQEIGAVRLLRAPEEVELAKEIENGRLIARYQRELVSNGQDISYEAVARYLLQRICKLVERFKPVIGADIESYGEILFAPSLQASIQMQIDTELAEAIADVIGTSGRQVVDDLWELSVASRLTTPEMVDAGPRDAATITEMAGQLRKA